MTGPETRRDSHIVVTGCIDDEHVGTRHGRALTERCPLRAARSADLEEYRLAAARSRT